MDRLLACSLAFASSVAADKISMSPWMDVSKSPAERAKLLIAEMRLDEKLIMLHGVPNGKDGDVVYVGLVKGNHRLGIPEMRLNDGYN